MILYTLQIIFLTLLILFFVDEIAVRKKKREVIKELEVYLELFKRKYKL